MTQQCKSKDELRHEWYEQHKDAQELVIDNRTGLPIGAIYYSWDWYDTPEVHRQSLRRFFQAVVDAQYLKWRTNYLDQSRGTGAIGYRDEPTV